MCPMSKLSGLRFLMVFSVVILLFPFYSVHILVIIRGLCLPAMPRALLLCSSLFCSMWILSTVRLLFPCIFCDLFYEFNLRSRSAEFVLVLDHNGSVFRTMGRVNVFCSDYFSRMCSFLRIKNWCVKILYIQTICRT